jgi:acyl carrier protein
MATERAGTDISGVRERLLSIIANISSSEVAVVRTKELFSEIKGWDSLSILEFVTDVDRELGVDLAPEEVDGIDRISDLVARIANARKL